MSKSYKDLDAVDKLDRTNWESWVIDVQLMLEQHGLWGFSDDTDPQPVEAKELAKWRERKSAARAMVCRSISKEYRPVAVQGKPARICLIPKSRARRAQLRANFKDAGLQISDEEQTYQLMYWLDGTWEATKQQLYSLVIRNSLSNKVSTVLQAEYNRRQADLEFNKDITMFNKLKAFMSGRGKFNNRKPKNGQDSSSQQASGSNDNANSSSSSFPNVQCFNCQEYGHYANRCKSEKVKRGDKSRDVKPIELEMGEGTSSVLGVGQLDVDLYRVVGQVRQKEFNISNFNANLGEQRNNRFPHSRVGNQIPYVLWRNRGLSFRHLRIPGSICYVHHTKPGRDKLDTRAWKGVLVGYAIRTRGYRIWNIETDELDDNQLEQQSSPRSTFDNDVPSLRDLESSDDEVEQVEPQKTETRPTTSKTSPGSAKRIEPAIPAVQSRPIRTRRIVRAPVVTRPGITDMYRGWEREEVERVGGASAGFSDVYYYAPDGTKLRSAPEVQQYCKLQRPPLGFAKSFFNFSQIPPPVETTRSATDDEEDPPDPDFSSDVEAEAHYTLDMALQDIGFTKIFGFNYVYCHGLNALLLVYVDDMVLFTVNKKWKATIVKKLAGHFNLVDLGYIGFIRKLAKMFRLKGHLLGYNRNIMFRFMCMFQSGPRHFSQVALVEEAVERDPSLKKTDKYCWWLTCAAKQGWASLSFDTVPPRRSRSNVSSEASSDSTRMVVTIPAGMCTL
uniref:CCHC-type domain-containing protein n=1 Tax=Strigamia maritima TaxID=126957 RepID=T1IHM6_STRMM